MLVHNNLLIFGKKVCYIYETDEFLMKVVFFCLIHYLQRFCSFGHKCCPKTGNLCFTACYTETCQNVFFHNNLLIFVKKVCYIYEIDEFLMKVVFFSLIHYLQRFCSFGHKCCPKTGNLCFAACYTETVKMYCVSLIC